MAKSSFVWSAVLREWYRIPFCLQSGVITTPTLLLFQLYLSVYNSASTDPTPPHEKFILRSPSQTKIPISALPFSTAPASSRSAFPKPLQRRDLCHCRPFSRPIHDQRLTHSSLSPD